MEETLDLAASVPARFPLVLLALNFLGTGAAGCPVSRNADRLRALTAAVSTGCEAGEAGVARDTEGLGRMWMYGRHSRAQDTSPGVFEYLGSGPPDSDVPARAAFRRVLECYVALAGHLERHLTPGAAAVRAAAALGTAASDQQRQRFLLPALRSVDLTQASFSLRYSVILHCDAMCLAEYVFFAASRGGENVKDHLFYVGGFLFSLSDRAALYGSFMLFPARLIHGTLASGAANEPYDLIGSALSTVRACGPGGDEGARLDRGPLPQRAGSRHRLAH